MNETGHCLAKKEVEKRTTIIGSGGMRLVVADGLNKFVIEPVVFIIALDLLLLRVVTLKLKHVALYVTQHRNKCAVT